MEEILGGVLDKTFSVAVAAFLLLRMERELRLLRTAIEGLRHCATCTLSPFGLKPAQGREPDGDGV